MKVVIDLKFHIEEADPVEVFLSNQADVLICGFSSGNFPALRFYCSFEFVEEFERALVDMVFVRIPSPELIIFEYRGGGCLNIMSKRHQVIGCIQESLMHLRRHCCVVYLDDGDRFGAMFDFALATVKV